MGASVGGVLSIVFNHSLYNLFNGKKSKIIIIKTYSNHQNGQSGYGAVSLGYIADLSGNNSGCLHNR